MTGVTAVPASFGQERLWFFDQLAPGSPLYNVHAGHVLRGPLDAAALGSALNAVVARHEVLRTTMRSVGGVPRQVIARRLDVPTPVTDLRHVPAADREDLTQRLAAEQAALPFDLAAGPLLRSELLRFADDEHAWLLTLHHAVCDAWSMGVLLRECSAAYRAVVAGTGEPDLAPLPLQYADFAVWQRGLADGPRWQRDLAHWTRHLAGAPAMLELPTDRPRPATQSFRGELTELLLPASLRDALAEFARGERTTLFAALLAVFQVTLARCTGSADVVVGTATAGRDRVELDGLIGLFANTLALRGTVDGWRGFRDLLRHTAEVVRDGQTHGGLPFERVVEALAPERQPSVNPVFQVMLDVQPGGPSVLDLPAVLASPLRVRDRRVSLFDLSVSVADEPTGLRLVCEYATDLFDATTARRLLRCLATVLDAAVGTPDRPVRELPLLAPEDRAAALATAIGPTTDVTGDRRPPCAAGGVAALVRTWVEEQPDSTALVDLASGERVTYADLGARVAALADELRTTGVRRGSLVGLFMDRSPAAVVAMLAVLEAGGAYLPLDPGYPAERLATMIADARPLTVLTVHTHTPRLPTTSTPVTECGIRSTGAVSTGAAAAGVEVDGEDLAYVMFTSGSTGRPKGVMVRHGALANYAAADRAAYRLTPDDRVLQFSPLSFDVSAEEVFPCLTAGATLVLRDDRMLDSPEDFLRACERHGVTIAHLPSAYFHELAPAATHAGRSLRAVAIGGEAANPARVAQWQRLAPHARLVNVYGPTETTIVTTMAHLDGAASGQAGRIGDTDRAGSDRGGGTGVPIGRPIPNSRVYVLDAELEPVPVGVVGEVMVGGAGLARGYLDDPAATAVRFVPDPHGPPGARLYRTGDRARVLPDGQLDFQGRTDGQLKIRGYRVEAGEVESALTHLDGVREAAVVARTGAGGHAELVAYVVAGGAVLDPVGLRAALAQRLPAFMVPAAIVVLKALPRTANDKLDRAALPDLVGHPTAAGTFVAPRGEVEELVAGVWREVLKVDRVGADDNFFTIGGHSLLAIQVVSRLRRTYGPQVGVRQLFEYPTLGAFAAALPAPTDLRPPPTGGMIRAASTDAGLAHLPAGAADLLRELDPR